MDIFPNASHYDFSYMCVLSLSHDRLFTTLWPVACQAPLFMGFSWQEYWSGLPFPPPGNLAHPGIEPTPPALAGGFFTAEPPGEPLGAPRMGSSILVL